MGTLYANIYETAKTDKRKERQYGKIMDKEKITARTKEEFIREVGEKCLAELTEEEKQKIRDNPCTTSYHFGYAMYIRNRYIHGKDWSEAGFWDDPDDLSARIMAYIISRLLPKAFFFNECFSEELFSRSEFVRLWKPYEEAYGTYPDELIARYRSMSPEPKSIVNGTNLTDLWLIVRNPRRREREFELYCREMEERHVIIDALIRELVEALWQEEKVRHVAYECGLDREIIEEKIKEVRYLFYPKEEPVYARIYLPMTVILLSFREKIGEERYIAYRSQLCNELGRHPDLYMKLDRSLFADREIVKTVLASSYAMGDFPEYADDKELVRIALTYDGYQIQYVNTRFLHDRDLVKLAITHSEGSQIMDLECMEPFRSDRELVFLACQADVLNFSYIDPCFHDDYDLAYMVLKKNDFGAKEFYTALSSRLKDDLSLALIDAAGIHPAVEEYSDRLKDNEQVAEKLIERFGRSDKTLLYMSDRIRKKYGC